MLLPPPFGLGRSSLRHTLTPLKLSLFRARNNRPILITVWTTFFALGLSVKQLGLCLSTLPYWDSSRVSLSWTVLFSSPTLYTYVVNNFLTPVRRRANLLSNSEKSSFPSLMRLTALISGLTTLFA